MDKWTIDIKSNRIPSKVMELMRSEKDANLRYLYNHLRQIPKGSIVAGRIFEVRVHRMLSDGWRLEGPIPQPTRMVSDSSDPPLFYVNPLSSTPFIPDNFPSSLAPVRDHKSCHANRATRFCY